MRYIERGVVMTFTTANAEAVAVAEARATAAEALAGRLAAALQDILERVVRPRDLAAVTSPSGETAVIEDDLIRDALSRIDEPFRSAFLLRHYFDWPVEDQDPAVRTISRHFGKDPRTIRNWLKKAEESLQTWRGEQR